MSRTDKYTDAEFLRMLRGHIGERIAACHEAETDERECGDENVAQAYSEERLWLDALLIQVKEQIES